MIESVASTDVPPFRLAPTAAPRDDRATVAAVAVIVYVLASLLHEGAGHGGACVAVHGLPRLLTSQSLDCDQHLLDAAARRWVAAGGTLATLAGGVVALFLYRRTSAAQTPAWRYALWLFAAVNLMQGAGYFLYSGLTNIGDWAAVIRGAAPAWPWRVGMTIAGGVAYALVVRLVFRDLGRLTGDARPARYHRARVLSLFAYLVGGALWIAAGLLNAAGLLMLALSGAAASLGGTSGLAWGPRYLRGSPRPASPGSPTPVVVRRSIGLVVVAALAALAFVLVLGRGVRLG